MQSTKRRPGRPVTIGLEATHQVSRAIKSGQLVRPNACEQCGASKKLDAHHDDYGKPLQVRWLCASCHRRWHAKNTAIEGVDGSKLLHLRIPRALKDKLSAIAKADGMTLSDVIRKAVERGIERELDGR